MSEETVRDIAREVFPDWADTELDYAIWNKTGFPCFWPDSDKSPMDNMRAQLGEFKEALSLGVRLCDFCNTPAEENSWACKSCLTALPHEEG